MGADCPKQFLPLAGSCVLKRTVEAFCSHSGISRVLVVSGASFLNETNEILKTIASEKLLPTVCGGSTRQESSYLGLCALAREAVAPDYVLIHDAARPLVEVEMIERAVAAVRGDASLAGAILASRSIDTLKLVEGDTIVATPDRSFYWAAQTPQVFRRRILLAAHRAAARDEYQGTDDSSLVERHGGRVRVVECSRDNIKVTVPEDLALAEAALGQRLIGQ